MRQRPGTMAVSEEWGVGIGGQKPVWSRWRNGWEVSKVLREAWLLREEPEARARGGGCVGKKGFVWGGDMKAVS